MIRFFSFLFVLLGTPLAMAGTGELQPLTPDYQSLEDCNTNMHENQLAIAEIDDLSPGQFEVGKFSVQLKEKKLGKKLKKDKDAFKAELVNDPVPIVIGNNKYYILDHHHESSAIQLLGRNKIVIKVIHNWNHLSPEEFEAAMIKNNYVYLEDKNGVTHPFSELPKHVNEMDDNPFRSLSGEVENENGFKKNGTFFIEFKWAKFFRLQGITEGEIKHHFKRTLKKAVKLAHSVAAAAMPGYIPPPPP